MSDLSDWEVVQIRQALYRLETLLDCSIGEILDCLNGILLSDEDCSQIRGEDE